MTKLIHKQGDLFTSTAPALGHGVNVRGAMGAGIALLFKRRFPAMFNAYKQVCLDRTLRPGGLFAYMNGTGPMVYNIASQDALGPNARLEWLESGLSDAIADAATRGYDRIAVPWIGAGIGGLEKDDVEQLFIKLAATTRVDIEVWSFEEAPKTDLPW